MQMHWNPSPNNKSLGIIKHRNYEIYYSGNDYIFSFFTQTITGGDVVCISVTNQGFVIFILGTNVHNPWVENGFL